jgi:hypothetical protein
METRTNSLNFTSESLNVVVLERKPSKFKQQWLFLFRSELSLILSQLQPTARALVLDALILGSINPQGLILAEPSFGRRLQVFTQMASGGAEPHRLRRGSLPLVVCFGVRWLWLANGSATGHNGFTKRAASLYSCKAG